MPVHTRDSWILNAGSVSTTISPDRESSYSFDLEGRPLSWLVRDDLFRRTFASDVHARSGRGAGRCRWQLERDEAAAALTAVLARAAEAPWGGLGEVMTARRDAILRWTTDSLLAEEERFRQAYHPVAILPPDQYRALVLQATVGCTWNRCTFCSFYQDRPFRGRNEETFRAHVAAVERLLGRAAVLRDRIFLADGDALTLPNDRLLSFMETARRVFPERAFAGFVEAHDLRRKPVADWIELRKEGLERVCLGLESGHDELLRFLNKPAGATAAADLIADLKSAGLGVAVVVLCGAGGDRFAAAHVSDTVTLLGRLPLGEGDIIYLSPFVEHPDSDYARRARAEHLEPLDGTGCEEQLNTLRTLLRTSMSGVKTARYDIREFLY